ncbi:MAG: hypothetical protein KAS86_02570 [Candidatus Omnitrophica bacterium]|nr:hypothetical protein [Candidatus Omnitrophota bacterium]
MKVLAKIKGSSDRYALVSLADPVTRGKVYGLINKGKYPQALLEVLAKGKLLREVSGSEEGRIAASLIITEKNAHWDLTA